MVCLGQVKVAFHLVAFHFKAKVIQHQAPSLLIFRKHPIPLLLALRMCTTCLLDSQQVPFLSLGQDHLHRQKFCTPTTSIIHHHLAGGRQELVHQ
ncbi:Hypp3844 [Branchiostoma lanceolatum]|uniref:Hypp3844 protein n=1 Tax=Branchiostoma lanceolatum TaxID=7740 RepID=A0A8K0EYU8_BRALA|nr:Hypp3844 [Branchiostoma lanceolatum]